METIKSICKKLNAKFSEIEDFNVYESFEGVIAGGFYKMSYNEPDNSNNYPSYYFHAVFAKEKEIGIDNLYNYLVNVVTEKLKWQKKTDESFALEMKKNIVYKYNYKDLL